MESSPKEKSYEITYIPMTNTRAYPWTVMVVDFNTKSTNTAMEWTRWSQNLTTCTITQFIMLIFRILYLPTLIIFFQLLIFKLVFIIKLTCKVICIYSLVFTHLLIEFFSCFIQNIKAFIWLHLLSLWELDELML